MKGTLSDWLLRLESMHPRAIELGLERSAEVYRRLGSPRPATKIWTVAGTNGKGSVTAYLESLLAAFGQSVACYTSPHILRFNERIRIDGRDASDREILDALQSVEEARQEISLTYFEFTTLAALLIFSRTAPDAAVLEVGLGGRLDAVNIIDTDCAVITAIGLDHMEYLGHDRELIGHEKAGIMRPGSPVVIGDPDPPVSVLESAARCGAPVLQAGRDFSLVRAGDECLYRDPQGSEWRLPVPPLPGRHQLDNLGTAITAFASLVDGALGQSERVRAGILATRLSGRLQGWPGDERLLLDVGHNPLAARAVAGYLESGAPGDDACVLGMLGDKDVEGVVGSLAPHVRQWYCAGIPGPRGLDGQALARRVGKVVGNSAVRHFPDVRSALSAARSSTPGHRRILVFGSFLTVAGAMDALNPHQHDA